MEDKQLLDPLEENSGIANYDTTKDARRISDGQPEEKEPQMPFRLRLIKTCAIGCIYIGLGFNGGVLGPSLIDLAHIVADGNVESVSHGVSTKALGMLAGSLFGGFFADRSRKKADLFLFLLLLGNGLSLASTPWTPTVGLIAVQFFIHGFVHGACNVACCTIVIAIWGEEAAAPIHSLHLCYSIGSCTAVPITGLFATPLVGNSEEAALAAPSSDQNSSTDTLLQNHTAMPDNRTRIYVPYGIFGAYQTLVSLAFLAFFLFGVSYTSSTIKGSKSLREMLDPSSFTNNQRGFGIYMMVSLFFLFICAIYRESAMTMYLYTCGRYMFGMSPIRASLLTLAYNLTFVAGRLISMVAAIFVRIQIMVMIELFAVLLWLIALSSVGLQTELSFWVLICFMSVFVGPNYPSVMAWADRYIEAGGAVVAIMDIGISVGYFVSIFVGGIVIQRYNARWIFHLMTISAGIMLLLFLPLQVVASKVGDRHVRRKTEADAHKLKQKTKAKPDGADSD